MAGEGARLTPRSHHVRQRMTHSFYHILHQVPVHIWGWNLSVIMVVHIDFSMNTTTNKYKTHFW